MVLGLILSLVLGGFRSFALDCESVQDEVLRLHIPANSDSAEDQSMKLRLRDHILNEYGSQLAAETDISAAKELIKSLLPEIEAECRSFLRENGADYSADVQLTKMYFATRTYENVTLPAGNYTALRITLGSGEGRNWWCVMYPPLCVAAATDKASLSDVMTEQECEIVTDAPRYEVRFKVVEWFSAIAEWFS